MNNMKLYRLKETDILPKKDDLKINDMNGYLDNNQNLNHEDVIIFKSNNDEKNIMAKNLSFDEKITHTEFFDKSIINGQNEINQTFPNIAVKNHLLNYASPNFDSKKNKLQNLDNLEMGKSFFLLNSESDKVEGDINFNEIQISNSCDKKCEINNKPRKQVKNNFDLLDEIFPQEKAVKAHIRDLFNYLHSFRNNLIDINEQYFKKNFEKIFDIEDDNKSNKISRKNIYDYFDIDKNTLIPSTKEIVRKGQILKNPEFWIIWIEYIAIKIKIREKVEFENKKSLGKLTKNDSRDKMEKNDKLEEEFFYKIGIIFGLFDASIQKNNSLEEILLYYNNFLRSLPLETIFILESKYKERNSKNKINSIYLYLTQASNELIKKWKSDPTEEKAEKNHNLNHMVPLYGLKMIKVNSSKSEIKKPVKNFLKSFISEKLDQIENEILNEGSVNINFENIQEKLEKVEILNKECLKHLELSKIKKNFIKVKISINQNLFFLENI